MFERGLELMLLRQDHTTLSICLKWGRRDVASQARRSHYTVDLFEMGRRDVASQARRANYTVDLFEMGEKRCCFSGK
jgi:hypothetical protein